LDVEGLKHACLNFSLGVVFEEMIADKAFSSLLLLIKEFRINEAFDIDSHLL